MGHQDVLVCADRASPESADRAGSACEGRERSSYDGTRLILQKIDGVIVIGHIDVCLPRDTFKCDVASGILSQCIVAIVIIQMLRVSLTYDNKFRVHLPKPLSGNASGQDRRGNQQRACGLRPQRDAGRIDGECQAMANDARDICLSTLSVIGRYTVVKCLTDSKRRASP